MRCLEGDKLKNNNFRDKKRFGWIQKTTIKPLYRFKFEKPTSPLDCTLEKASESVFGKNIFSIYMGEKSGKWFFFSIIHKNS